MYGCRHTTNPLWVRVTRTGYKSRGLNGPPYFSTSFKHFFTVESLFACNRYASKLMEEVEDSENGYDGHEFLGYRLAGGKEAVDDAIAASKEVEEDLY
jgi:hypothetical protein